MESSRVVVVVVMAVVIVVVAATAVAFLPARRYASAGLCDSNVSGRLSVCLSVRHMPVLCLAEQKQDREMYTI